MTEQEPYRAEHIDAEPQAEPLAKQEQSWKKLWIRPDVKDPSELTLVRIQHVMEITGLSRQAAHMFLIQYLTPIVAEVVCTVDPDDPDTQLHESLARRLYSKTEVEDAWDTKQKRTRKH